MKTVTSKGFAKDDDGNKHVFSFQWEKLETDQELSDAYSTIELLDMANTKQELDQRTPAAAEKRAEVKTAVNVTLQRSVEAMRYILAHDFEAYRAIAAEFGQESRQVKEHVAEIWLEHCK